MCTGVALASPKTDAREKFRVAEQLDSRGDYDKALVVVNEGLAIAPRDVPLLGLKGVVLLKLRDYPGALAAYQAFLDAGATGGNRHHAQKIVNDLRALRSTFLDITLANGPATIYLGSKALGRFCTAAPSCRQPILPDVYNVIAERDGFESWTGPITVEIDRTTKLAITLVEKPSLLTVRVAQSGARIMIDDTPYQPPATIAAGTHRVVISLAGHVETRLAATAHEGKPVELDVALTALVPVRVVPAHAELRLDGRPVAIANGAVALAPGAHVLVAHAPGFHERRLQIAAARAPDTRLVLELARVESSAVRFTPRRRIALGAGGVALGATAAGVVFGLQSRALARDALDLCPVPSDPCTDASKATRSNHDARTRALEANISFGIAGGAAIAAAVLWLTGAPESSTVVTPHLGAVSGLDLTMRF